MSTYDNEWNKKNWPKRYQYSKKFKDKAKQWLRDYKTTLKCSRCEENHPSCLDFHHVDGYKEVNVSSAPGRGWSVRRIKKEIEKCVVLCANCHRKEHASVAQTAERLSCKEDVAGATPASSSKFDAKQQTEAIDAIRR